MDLDNTGEPTNVSNDDNLEHREVRRSKRLRETATSNAVHKTKPTKRPRHGKKFKLYIS